jgi:hypothetical protein
VLNPLLNPQPFAPHVGHSPPWIPKPLHVSQGAIFLFNGVERILAERYATLIILLMFFKIYRQKCCCVEREISIKVEVQLLTELQSV